MTMTLVARSLLNINTLDEQIQQEICKYGKLKDFRLVVCRQEPDATGCNWIGHIERVRGSRSSSDLRWWDVLPRLRQRYNLE